MEKISVIKGQHYFMCVNNDSSGVQAQSSLIAYAISSKSHSLT